MIAIIGVGCYGGIKLDEAFPNTYSLWTISSCLVAVVIAMVYVIRRVTPKKEQNKHE